MIYRWLLLTATFVFMLGASIGCGPECPEGQTKCGETCVNLQIDRSNCGACGTACSDGEVCDAGKCKVSCQKGLTECGGTCTNTKTDIKNCGECGTECKDGETCADGKCSPNCPDGQSFCDGVCVNTDTDPANCGGCKTKCDDGKACKAGKCEVTCPVDFTDCSGTCVNTKANRANCGACGTACKDGEVCNDGTCTTTCQKGLTDCSGVCANIKTNTQHCGACGKACRGGEVCTDGKCELTCDASHKKCGDVCVDVQVSRTHCGTCGTACKAGEVCKAGKCELNCPPSYKVCNDTCINTQNDAKNCGACGNACGKSQVCDAGKCKAFCQAGYTDCNNSCTNTQTDKANCGACGQACPGNQICKAGKCEETCAPGEATCGGACINTKNDTQHCGACGNACKTGEVCIDGGCNACTDCPKWAVKAGSFNSEVVGNVAVDSKGNVYAIGTFSKFTVIGGTKITAKGASDIFVMKMSPAGRIIWTISAGGTDTEIGYGIRVDKSDNVYVLGYFSGTANFGTLSIKSAGSSDVFVAQLNSKGVFQWVKGFGGTGTDYGYALAVDDSGNSYITGAFRDSVVMGSTTLSSKGGEDIFVAKLDNKGAVAWAAGNGGSTSSSSNERGHAIAVDATGNVYVTGRYYSSLTWDAASLTSKGSSDVFVLKFDTTGKVVWGASGGGSSIDLGLGLTLDKQGNVYITGQFSSSGADFDTTKLTSNGSYDVFVAKVDTTGKWSWAVGMGGKNADAGFGIGVDSTGNIYTAGYFDTKATFGSVVLSDAGTSQEIYLAQITPAGKIAGALRVGGADDDRAINLTVDSKDNIFICGDFGKAAKFSKVTLLTSGGYDGFVAKYTKPSQPFCPSTGSVCNGICIDTSADNNNCGACGNKCTGTQVCGGGVCKECTDCPKAMLSAASSHLSGYGYSQSTTTDAAGNMYYTGYYYNEIEFGATKLTALGNSDIFVAKADKTGKWLWAKSLGNTGYDYAYDITVDANENVYLTGRFNKSISIGLQTITSKGRSDIFVIKLDKNGGPVWGVSGGGSSDDYGYGISVDSAGNAYVAGYVNGSSTFGLQNLTSNGSNDIFVGKISPAGAWLWTKNFGGTGSDYAFDLALDSSNNIYVTGSTLSSSIEFGLKKHSPTSRDVFVVKLDNSGNPLWSVVDGGTSYQYSVKLAIDSKNNVYITGEMWSSGATFGGIKLTSNGSDDAYIAKLDSTGKWLWAKNFGGSGSLDQGYGVAVDSKDNVYLSGMFGSTMTVSPFTLTSLGSADLFIIKMDGQGNILGAISGGGTGSENSRHLHIGSQGDLYIAAYTSSSSMTFSLKTYPRATKDYPAPFILRFGATPCPLSGSFSVCGDACVDTSKDDNNCGSCANKCGTGTTCQAGTCK